MKRLFDIFFSLTGIIILSPFFIIISLLIIIDSGGGVFYRQTRVGKNNKDFKLYKFRSMKPGSSKAGLLTVGGKDKRISRVGYFLRNLKLDELPQLYNILKGDMSFIGPRPEVRKYVDLYDTDSKKVLEVKPGLTDYASIEYINENEILGKAKDPEKLYIEEVMPAKLKLNLKYISEKGFYTDLIIILKTIKKIISRV